MSEIIEVVVTSTTPTVETTAFSNILFIAEVDEVDYGARTATFTSPDDVVEVFPDPFHPVRLAANAAFSDPDYKPDRFIFARRTPGTSEVHAFEVERGGGAVVDGSVEFLIDGVGVVDVEFSEADVAEDVADKLAAGINELNDHPFRATVEEDVGFFLILTSQYGSNEYGVEFEVDGDVSITADAAKSVDAVASLESISDVLNEVNEAGVAYFGVTMLSTRSADQSALAERLQGGPLLGAIRKNDPDGDEETDPEAEGHVYANLKASGYRDILPYSHPEPWRFPELRNFGPTLGIDPDESATTFALRSPFGIQRRRYAVPRAQAETAMRDLNVNYFRREHGITISWEGTVAEGEYADIVWSEKWLTARLKERGFALIQGAVQAGGKVPYDDDGAAALESEIRGMVSDAIGAGHITASIDPEYTVPQRADIPTAQVQSRQFPPIVVEAFWAGAVHRAQFRFVLLF